MRRANLLIAAVMLVLASANAARGNWLITAALASAAVSAGVFALAPGRSR